MNMSPVKVKLLPTDEITDSLADSVAVTVNCDVTGE